MFRKYWIFGINYSSQEQWPYISTAEDFPLTCRRWKLLFSIKRYGIYISRGVYDQYS